MKRILCVLAIMMIAVSMASACSSSFQYDQTNLNINLFEQRDFKTTAGCQQLSGPGFSTVKCCGGTTATAYLMSNPSLSPIVPDNFTIILGASYTTGVFEKFIFNSTSFDLINSTGSGIPNKLVHIQYTSPNQVMTCFGTTAGTKATTLANFSYHRIAHQSGSDQITADFSPDNATWYPLFNCTIPDLPQFKFQTLQIGYSASSATTNCFNLTMVKSDSTQTLSANFRVTDEFNSTVPNCTITNFLVAQGSPPFYSQFRVNTTISGLTPTISYFPSCAFDNILGYAYAGVNTVSCPNKIFKQFPVIATSATDPTLINVSVENSTTTTTLPPTNQSVCFQTVIKNTTGPSYIPITNAAIILQYIIYGDDFAATATSSAITDSIGKATFNIDGTNTYTVSAYKYPTYDQQTVFSSQSGNFLINFANASLGGCVIVPLDPAISATYSFNVTVNKNGNTIGCSAIHASILSCDEQDYATCQKIVPISSTNSMYDSTVGNCYWFSTFQKQGSWAYVEAISSGIVPTASDHAWVQMTQPNTKTVPLTFQANLTESNQLCFRFQTTVGSTVSNVQYRIDGDSSIGQVTNGTASDRFCVNVPFLSAAYRIRGTATNYAPFDESDIWSSTSDNPLVMTPTSNTSVKVWINGTVKGNDTNAGLQGYAVSFTYSGTTLTNYTDSAGGYIIYGIPMSTTNGRLYWDGGSDYYSDSMTIPLISSNITQNRVLNKYSGVGKSRQITIYTREDKYPITGRHEYSPLCQATVTLNCPGYGTVSGKSSGDSCAFEYMSGIDGCEYSIAASKTNYDGDSKTLPKNRNTETLTLQKITSYQGCSVGGVVTISNNSIAQTIAGVVVSLFDISGNFITQDTTASNGSYSMNDGIQCETGYTLKATYQGSEARQPFTTKAEGKSTIPLTISLSTVQNNGIIDQMASGLMSLWPFIFIILVMFIIWVLTVILDG